MPPRTDLILVLDLEATGSDKNVEDIVEVGVVALGAPDWHVISTFTSLVEPTQAAYERMMAHDVVRPMHEASGLLAEIDRVRHESKVMERLTNSPGAWSVERVEADLLVWLNSVATTNTNHIPYGGSGVSHYDRPLIDRLMPRFSKRLTFWAYDVGNVRRIARLAGNTEPWPDQSGKNHRALDDALFHVEEFRHSLRILAPKEAAS